MSSLTFERVGYGGWQNCWRLSNGQVDLILSGEFGPRVLRFGFVGQHNELAELYDASRAVPSDQFRLYGGHRFWAAPESTTATYYPDNQPIEVNFADDLLTAAAPIEHTTGLQKTLQFSLSPSAPRVLVTHSLTNHSVWPIQVSPWALTCMAPGGTAILPLPPRGSHEGNLLPTGHLMMWAYTDFSDPRWTFTPEYVLLKGDPTAQTPQKIGAPNIREWLAYARGGHLFVKQYEHIEGAAYPDGGCSSELFTIHFMLEVETLGPLVTLSPGETIDHVETWSLLRDVPEPRTMADITAHILPRLTGLA